MQANIYGHPIGARPFMQMSGDQRFPKEEFALFSCMGTSIPYNNGDHTHALPSSVQYLGVQFITLRNFLTARTLDGSPKCSEMDQ